MARQISKYLLDESVLSVAPFKVPGWISYLPTMLRFTYKDAYKAICVELEKHGSSIKEFETILNNKPTPVVLDAVANLDKNVDSLDPKLYNFHDRLTIFGNAFAEEIAPIISSERSRIMEVLYRTITCLLPKDIFEGFAEVLSRLGLDPESVIPLIKGRGSKESYLQTGYMVAVHLEQTLLPIYDFFEKKTGEIPEFVFQKRMSADDNPLPIILVTVQNNSGKSETIHFPNLVPWTYGIIEKMREDADEIFSQHENSEGYLLLENENSNEENTPLLLISAPQTNDEQ